MTASSRRILQSVVKPSPGAALYDASQGRAPGSARNYTAAQREYFAALAEVRQPKPESYIHPARTALPLREPGPLTAIELAWLQRVPTDPRQVSFEDAQALASLSRSLEGATGQTDSKRLVAAIWNPVRELHDRAAAEVELRNAERPQPNYPRPGNALADAIAVENPDLTPSAVIALATDKLDAAMAERDAERNRTIAKARATLADLDSAAEHRVATTRTAS